MSKQPVFAGEKLTKKFFRDLPTGFYLVSGVGDSPLTPDFAQYIVPSEERENQWQEIRAARVDQRCCNVFQTKEESVAYSAAWHRMPDGLGWYRSEEKSEDRE